MRGTFWKPSSTLTALAPLSWRLLPSFTIVSFAVSLYFPQELLLKTNQKKKKNSTSYAPRNKHREISSEVTDIWSVCGFAYRQKLFWVCDNMQKHGHFTHDFYFGGKTDYTFSHRRFSQEKWCHLLRAVRPCPSSCSGLRQRWVRTRGWSSVEQVKPRCGVAAADAAGKQHCAAEDKLDVWQRVSVKQRQPNPLIRAQPLLLRGATPAGAAGR